MSKLLKAGFIEEIKCPEWLTKKKKGGHIRIYVDFRDLNKACPKDEFPLPNVDILVDVVAGHEWVSYIDGYSGDNQIFMDLTDA